MFLIKMYYHICTVRHIRIKIWVDGILPIVIPCYSSGSNPNILPTHVKTHNTLCVQWIILYFVYQIIRFIIRIVAIFTQKRTHKNKLLNKEKRNLNHICVIANRWKMTQRWHKYDTKMTQRWHKDDTNSRKVNGNLGLLLTKKSRRHSFIFWERCLYFPF